MKHIKYTIAFDLDYTLCKSNIKMINTVKELYKRGHKIILFTNSNLTFNDYTNIDEGFHSPKFIITNSKIEIHQIVE